MCLSSLCSIRAPCQSFNRLYEPSNDAHWAHGAQAAAVTAPGTWAELEKGAKLSLCFTNISKVKLEPKNMPLENWSKWSCCTKLSLHCTSEIKYESHYSNQGVIFLIRLLQMCRKWVLLQQQSWVLMLLLFMICCLEYSVTHQVWSTCRCAQIKMKENILFLTKAGIFWIYLGSSILFCVLPASSQLEHLISLI